MTDGTTAAPETGYAPVNGLQMYYELHGDGGEVIPRCCSCTAGSSTSSCSSAH